MNILSNKLTSGLGIASLSILMFGCSNNIQDVKSDISQSAVIENSDKAIFDQADQLYKSYSSEVTPEFSSKGEYNVGVKTIEITNPAQLDATTQTLKDRKLTIEVWYPTGSQSKSKTVYKNETRTGIPFTIQADAYRDTDVLIENADSQYPVIVLSHGYTGYRTIMFYLGEHLASHGYIVASIDHTDSTNAEVDMKNSPFSGFVSTLLNRSRDQQFTLNYFTESDNFLSQAVDKQNAGLIGYSMGGFGAINTIGGCYNFNEQTGATFTGLKDPKQIQQAVGLLNSCAAGQYKDVTVDKKWKAAMAFAPWGGQHGLFNAKALSSITTPVLYVGGDLDDVSGYEGIKSLYNQTGSENKYLLTYKNARHNVAPHPAPVVSYGSELDIGHYLEPAWSSITLNNTNKHFALALMDCHVKKQSDKCTFLDLTESSNQLPINGKTPDAWKGFDHRFATGMEWSSK
jgi:predicted dienelactone hydrolase